MAGGQTLTANILINASANVKGAAAELMGLASSISGIQSAVVDFGKESTTVYRNYEKQMADAEVALSTTYGQNSAKLREVMDGLDDAANDWAAASIFHTNDVAEAINNAAHAGWDYEEIMAGIPAAMQLAQTGGMELADSVDYIIKATTAAGVSFEDLTGFTDQWAFAADSSATNVEEMGQAMLGLGSMMKFTDSTEELFTLMAALANTGTVGSEAGTMLRNSIIRLAAPTASAKGELEALGVTAEEYAQIMGEEGAAASEAMASIGFSAYDSQGNLKSIIQMYEDLYQAMGGLSEEEANSVLQKVFGSRTIVGALNLLESAGNGWDGLYEKMKGGEYAGFGEYASETMLETLDGQIETFTSKIEKIQNMVGSILSPDIERVLGTIGGVLDGIGNMDTGTMEALVSGLTAFAGVGATTMAAGSVLSVISKLITPTGAVFAGTTALIAAAAAMNSIAETSFTESFGEMKLDLGGLTTHVAGITAQFAAASATTNGFKDALNQSIESYRTASSEFSGSILNGMLTENGELTPEDLTELTGIGEKMCDAIGQGITARANADTSFWATLLTGTDGEGYLDSIVGVIEQTAEGAKERLSALGKELRSALASGFADGSISLDERQAIMDIVSEMNEIAAQTQELEMRTQQKKWLWQAQNASWDDVAQIAGMAGEEMNTQLADWESSYLDSKARLIASYEMYGQTVPQDQLDAMDARYEAQRLKIAEGYDEFLVTLLETTMSGSEFGDSYSALMSYASGFLTGMGPMMGDFSGISTGDWKDMGEAFSRFIDTFGGSADLYDRISGYESTNPQLAQRLAALMVAAEQTSGYMMGGSNYSVNMGVTGGYGGMFGYGSFSSGNQRYYGDAIGPESASRLKDWGTDFTFGKGNPSDLEGIGLEVEVTGNTDALSAAIQALSGQTVYVDVVANSVSTDESSKDTKSNTKTTTNTSKMKKYALGGRATTASIFGEAGAEWAIPEAHTARTYSLLNAAISATGFGGEIGGTLVYSPTINAVDAGGVETVLIDDKRRLERMLEDRRLREEAVRYQ